MPVAANVRIAVIATDPTAAAQSDGAAPAEIFGEIISGLAEASVEGALEAPVPVTAEAAGTEPPPHVGEIEVAETVEQLLALASSRPAGAKPATPSRVEAPKDELPKDELPKDGTEMPVPPLETVSGKDVPVPQTVAGVLPAISPRALYRPVTLTADVQTPVLSTDQPQPETSAVSDLPQIAPLQTNFTVAQAPADVPQAVSAPAPAMAAPVIAAPVIAAPVIAAKAASADRTPQVGPIPAADQPSIETPRIASSRTEAVVQLAFSGLEAAVKAMPAQTSTALSGVPARRSSKIEPTVSLSELKLTTAMTLP